MSSAAIDHGGRQLRSTAVDDVRMLSMALEVRPRSTAVDGVSLNATEICKC